MESNATKPTNQPLGTGLRFAGVLSALLAALVAVSVAGAAPARSSDSVGTAALPKAKTWTERGLDGSLADVHGTLRVRITLSDQPILVAIAAPEMQSEIAPLIGPGPLAAKAAANADRITTLEKRIARGAEQHYEAIVARLDHESAETIADQHSVIAALRDLGGKILEREVVPSSIVARVDAAVLSELAATGGVAAVEPSPRNRPLLNVAMPLTGADDWHAAGFTGGSGPSDVPSQGDSLGADVAMVGDAANPAHPAFAGVTIDNQELLDDHGSHVGGVIASQDATYRGAAPGVDRLIGAARTAYALGVADQTGPGAIDPAETISRSSGVLATADNHNDSEDVVVSLFGVGWAISGGNDNCGIDSACGPGEGGAPSMSNIGRNQLSMAALADLGTAGISDDTVLSVSSRGPSPGGRKKPDLIAPGGAITAPQYPGMGFDSLSGTSLAAPFAASGMALLEGSGVTDPIAQRAILINSALPWDGRAGNAANEGPSPTVPQTSWQPAVGWGVLNLTGALADRQNYVLGSVREGEAAFYRASTPTTGQKATLAWNMRGTWDSYPAQVPGPIVYTVTNLNLRQYNAAPPHVEISPPADPGYGGGPDAIDPNDNVEQVHAAAATPQTIYKVEAASTVEGLTAEPFALAHSAPAPLEQMTAPLVQPQGSAADPASPVSCATDLAVATTLRNESDDLEAENASVTLGFAAGVQLVTGDPTQTVSGGTLETMTTSETHTWTVRATTSGSKTLTVSGTGTGLGTPFTRTQNVSFTADCAAPSASITSGPADPGNDPTPTFAFSADEPEATFECSLDGDPFAPCSSPKTYDTLPDGPHSFAVRASDGVANIGPAATRSFTIDTVAPETTLFSGPDEQTNDQRPRFTFGSPDPTASFECSLDQGPFAPCGSPHTTLLRLADGRHTYAVRAKDAAGNADPTPATRDFTIDTEVDYKAKARARQLLSDEVGIKVKVQAREPIGVTLAGTVSNDGVRYPLAEQKLEFGAGERARPLLVPTRAGDARKILKLLGRGEQLRAELRVRGRDGLGNRERVELSVALEGS